MLRHLAFFETLASLEEDSPRWTMVSAGLLVLRAFDDWVERADALAGASTELAAVRRVVRQLPSGPMRALLDGILDELQSPDHRPQRVLPRLLAYGRALHFESEWALASSVTARVVELARELSGDDVHDDLTLDALQQLALTLRVQGRLEEAEATYTELERRAVAAGERARALRARIGQAKVWLSRGNLPTAERWLDDVVAEAQEHGLPMVAGIALHDRAAVAHARGDHALAVRLLFEAMRLTEDPSSRDAMLGDIAANLISLGAYAPARDALVVLTLTAQEAIRRLAAEINLFELAIHEGNELAFEQHRRALAVQAMPPELEAHYHLYAARGLLAFGRDSALVRQELTRARQIATERAFHQLRFQVEAFEQALARGAPVPAWEDSMREEAVELPNDLADVAVALTELREVAELVT